MTATMQREPAVEPATRAVRNVDSGGTASVLKALQLLDVFRSGSSSMGVSELARRAGFPVSTAYRLLAYLVDGGFVVKEGTQYRLADKLFELGNQVAHSRRRGLREVAAPHLGELYRMTGATARLGVLDDRDVVIVDKIVGLQTLPAPTAVGGRVPATCSALGKAMLAHLPPQDMLRCLEEPLPRMTRHSITSPGLLHRQLVETRRTRLAFDREETILGQLCVATPLLAQGKVIAAISLSLPTHRTDANSAATALLRAARQIESALIRLA